MNDEPLIDQTEAMRILGVSLRQLQRLLAEKKDPLPAYTFTDGGRRKFYASEIRAWIRRRGRAATTEK
jgi:predicted DNA-binding transcriptional regulator AlpA